MTFQVVSILARARHGKDTLAEFLLVEYGFRRIALADALKEEVAAMYPDEPAFQVSFDPSGRISYGIPDEEVDPVTRKFRRRVWQLWGTEGRRALFPDFWLWRWAPRAVQAMIQGAPGVVVPDVRFWNEAVYFSEMGAQIIAVDRGTYRDPSVDYTHASERDIPLLIQEYADLTIPNHSTYDDYLERIRRSVPPFLGSVSLTD